MTSLTRVSSKNSKKVPSPKIYAARIAEIFNDAEHRLFGRLDTPERIQDYLESLPMNFSQTAYGPRRSIRRRTAQCLEGALIAAAALAYHGHPPLLMDFQTIDEDEDHVITVFRRNGLWGATSLTNHAVLRYRDPIYKTPRELAMSYVHEYFMTDDGRKSLLAFSEPFDLRRYRPERWITPTAQLWWLADALDRSPHVRVIPPLFRKENNLRPVSRIECNAFDGHRAWTPEKKSVGKHRRTGKS